MKIAISMTVVLLIMLVGLSSCQEKPMAENAAQATPKETPEQPKKYAVTRAATPPPLDGAWTGDFWGAVEPVELGYWMGEKPAHRPKTQAKLAYDDTHIHVIFRVEDQYVRSVTQEAHGPVCRDSCVELFFTPGADTTTGYFNAEINCGGTMLFHWQKIPWKDQVKLPVGGVKIYHSLPKKIDPEITEPTTWTVQAAIPLDLLATQGAFTPPAPGVVWRANLYKCADATSHPHWLTWSHVDNPRPNFHLPQYFGRLVFK